MIGRLITLVLMGLAFYWGLQAERYLQKDRCLDAGGVVDARGLCDGARSQ